MDGCIDGWMDGTFQLVDDVWQGRSHILLAFSLSYARRQSVRGEAALNFLSPGVATETQCAKTTPVHFWRVQESVIKAESTLPPLSSGPPNLPLTSQEREEELKQVETL